MNSKRLDLSPLQWKNHVISMFSTFKWLFAIIGFWGFFSTLGSVRLHGGKNEFEGTVEVYANGVWGTICSSHWDDSDASVVCHQLQLGWVRPSLTKSVWWYLRGMLGTHRYCGEVTSSVLILTLLTLIFLRRDVKKGPQMEGVSSFAYKCTSLVTSPTD